jgi:Na+/proline symporter
MLPEGVGLKGAIANAAHLGKMNVITTGFTKNGFDWKDKYNIWSGLIGGFFLALSYFGTDHSQVGRYLTAKSIEESRKGLLMNGLVKVPMQFFILLIGILIFSFYLQYKAPVFFDQAKALQATQTSYGPKLQQIEHQYNVAFNAGKMDEAGTLRKEYKHTIQKALPGDEANDTNFIFLRFVKDNLPVGLIGLLFSVIFLSAWGSIAAALNSLAACTVVDFHKRFFVREETDFQDYKISQWYTFAWGMFSIVIAMFAHNIGNSLIEAVNILGSLFYGVILGVFLVAFLIKKVKGNAVFVSAIISEIIIIIIYASDVVSFLWLNVIGALLVIILSLIIQVILDLNDVVVIYKKK